MTTATPTSRLRAEKIELRYADRTIVDELSLEIPDGGFTVVVGPNGCGKSTLLRALGRMLAPRSGRVVLDGNDIRSYRTKEVARRIALLPQSPLSPGAISVADLVSRGRYPYQSMLRQWSPEDEHVVSEALNEVGMRYTADQLVDELSGGQRQRVWIAMTLAQRTPGVVARRTDHLSRHRTPDRGSRPLFPTPPVRSNIGRGPARPEPRGQICHARSCHAVRKNCHAGQCLGRLHP